MVVRMVVRTMNQVWSWGVVLGLASTGCGPRIDDAHCLFHGGDRGCGENESCIVVIEGGSVPGAGKGCVDASDSVALDPERYLHLRYGLPESIGAEGDALESDSVQGILAREIALRGLDDVCSIADGLPTEIEGLEAIDTIVAARRRLELLRTKRRIRNEQAFLGANEAAAVNAFYAAIGAWSGSCEELLASAGSGTDAPSASDDSTSTGSTTSESTGSQSTDSGTAGPCVTAEDCADADASFCAPSGECVSCSALDDPDGACSALDPTTPVCVDGACTRCTGHDQCSAACNLSTGSCFPLSAVVHVGPGDMPSIEAAVASFESGTEGTIIIHEDYYHEEVLIDGARTLALLAAPGDLPSWDASGDAQLTVQGATVFVQGLRIAGNGSGPGLVVEGGFAWLDRVRLIGNESGAVITNDAGLVLNNCIIFTVNQAALDVQDSSSATFVYSTLAHVFDGPLRCDPESSVIGRNSIVAGDFSAFNECSSAQLSHSGVTGDFDGEGNVHFGGANPNWFMDFFQGDLHLDDEGEQAFGGVALRQAGDPMIDIDGDPRPGVDGTPDYAGADVPP